MSAPLCRRSSREEDARLGRHRCHRATCALGASLPAAAADGTTATAGAAASAYGLDTSSLNPHQKDLVDKILAAMPAGWQERAAATAAEFGVDDTPWANILDGVINPGDYQCSNTALTAYARDTLKDADPVFRFVLGMLGVGTLAMYDAMLTADDPKSTTFGVNGEYTNQLRSEGKDLKKFWDIDSDDIQIVPMHGGDVFSSPERLARALYMQVPIGSVEGKLPVARWLIELINSEPALKGGTNPYFTFNAIAYTEKGSSHPRASPTTSSWATASCRAWQPSAWATPLRVPSSPMSSATTCSSRTT